MKRPDLFASAFLTALAAAAGAAAYRLGPGDIHSPGPGLMPLATATLLGLMALGQLGRELLVAGGSGPGAFTRSRGGTVIVLLGALAGFGLVLDRAGFALSALLMLAVLFGVVAGKRWWVALLAALLIAAVARLVFRTLGTQLPEGPFRI